MSINHILLLRYKSIPHVIIICLIAIVGLSAFAFNKIVWFAPHKVLTKSSSASGPPQKKIEVELITLTPGGFEPAEINREEGSFLIAVDNRTGIEREIMLRLNHIAGNSIREVNRTAKFEKSRNLVDLKPGQYQLTVADRPDWTCQIIITAITAK